MALYCPGGPDPSPGDRLKGDGSCAPASPVALAISPPLEEAVGISGASGRVQRAGRPGRRASLNVSRCASHGPDDVVLTNYFTARDRRIVTLIIIATEPTTTP